MAATKMRWGDALDDDEDASPRAVLPPPSVSGPDARGVKTYIEYRKNEKGDTVKVTNRVRVTKVQKKLYKAVEERKQLKRFGDAARQGEGDAITAQSTEDIPFERVRQQKQTQEEKKADLKQALQGTDKGAIVNNLKDVLYKRRMERKMAEARGEYQSERPPDEENEYGEKSLPVAGSKGGYVPPSLKNRQTGETDLSMRRREENSLRITNLSEDTRDEDLRELFSTCGPISRVYIAFDRQTGDSRGFGFVNFVHKADAEQAIQRLNGHGYDSLILQVEWAQPRAERT